MKTKEDSLSFRQFWGMIGPAFSGTFWSYVLISTLIIIAAFAQVADPIIFGHIVDAIIVGPDGIVGRTLPLVAFWALAFTTNVLLWQLAQWLSWRLGHQVNGAFFTRMMTRVLAWDPDRFGRESSGAIAKRIDTAWSRSYDVASRVLTDIFPQVVSFLVVFFVGIFLDWRMLLASMVMIPFMAFMTLRVYVKTDQKQAKVHTSWEDLSSELYELFANILPIKIFNGEDRALRQISQRTKDVAKRQIALDKMWGFLGAGNGLLRVCARIVVIGVGVFLISRGEVTFGVVVTFFSMLNQLLSPFDYLLADLLRRARQTQSAFARLERDWEEENLLVEVKNARRLRDVKGEVVLKGVGYRYPGKQTNALHDISLQVPAGSSLALVGRSGSGKSTLIKMVNRFLDPTKGEVLLDGVNLREANIADVRRSVGVVQQETVLLNDTILKNLTFARSNATKAEVIAACKAAQAHGFIMKLPKGYATVVGERGVRLSGGERQRLSLARVFLANPPVLVLDESTSALDSETETEVQKAIAKIMKNRTTIVIAHRLSTVYLADRIAVLDGGKIVEIGTHDELRKHGGIYEKLWMLQSGGYFPE